ncbi:MAG: TraR/DksA family transcriptional regulator [Caldilineales bacterium]|nr:TraR/DksA family transcriptional regulator [Caldilineales bacterium]MDW8317916.1 TraR/DksA C4-type zinc finger protein [Anaerolineae bacterium]
MKPDYSRLRQKLEAERAELLDAISRYEVVARQKRPGLGNHMADDGTEAFEQAASLALHRNEQALLDQVERALARMDKGTYGVCERCSEPIDYARLEALPYASLCIRCQAYVEMPRFNGKRHA